MTTHDVLAFAVATEAIGQVRRSAAPWSTIFSPSSYVSASRSWPMPDFVVVDSGNNISAAAEFKPPDQSKREYLTGLGQAVSYSQAFDYAFLILPTFADDGFPISDFVIEVLNQAPFVSTPIGVLTYDPATISPTTASFTISRFFPARSSAPTRPARLDNSFYAKWREISPTELALYVDYLYEEMRRPSASSGSIRNRAFDRLWNDLQSGALRHWGGGTRHAADTPTSKEAWRKNYRNFVNHIGWMDTSGVLTEEGLEGLHISYRYRADSVIFTDMFARSLLGGGKHLVLLNAINEIQDDHIMRRGPFLTEADWLAHIESELDNRGLLKRNPGRAGAAIRHSRRQFLKAEKQIWKNLSLIVPRGLVGGRVYHPGRGFIMNWTRITELLNS